MRVWATTFDTLIFSYIMKLNVIVIGNYLNGFSANNMHHYLLQLRLPDVIPDKPAIHVYFHRLGSPLEITSNCSHFSYLKPTSIPTDERINCDLQNSQRQPIVSQYQEYSIALTQVHTSAIPTPPILSTPPIGLTERQCSLPPATISQDSDVLDKEGQCSILSIQISTSATPPTPSTPSTLSTSPTESTTPTHLIKQTVTPGSNTLTLPVVPNLCNTINRNEVLDECLTQLRRTNTT